MNENFITGFEKEAGLGDTVKRLWELAKKKPGVKVTHVVTKKPKTSKMIKDQFQSFGLPKKKAA